MVPLQIDVVSIVFVLTVINLAALVFVAVHRRLTAGGGLLGYFLFAKAFQGLSWALRIFWFLSGSAWANGLADLTLLAGFALESALLVNFVRPLRFRDRAAYLGVFGALVGSALAAGVFSTDLRNLLMFMGFLGLLWYAAIRLLRDPAGGRFQKFLALLYLVLPLGQSVCYALFGPEVGVPGWARSAGALVYFSLLLTLQLVGSLGYLLMVKERDMELLREQATHDPLTGVLNRRAFFERAGAQLAQAIRRREPISLIIADLDHFKTINDRHSHQTGDRALRLFCQAVGGSIRQGDLFARNGGDEFVLCLPATPGDTALVVAERIRTSFKTLAQGAGDGLPVLTVSLGIGTGVPRSPESLQQLMASADTALYAAKNRGRDRVELTAEVPVAP